LSNDIGRRVREFVSSDVHKLIFPKCRIVDDNAAVHRFGLSAGGNFYAVGAGGPITGRGADLLVLDDMVKGIEEAYSSTARKSLQAWFESVAYTRLQPGAAIVAIGTRWHQDDVLGWLLKEHATDGWTVVSLPAIAEPGDPLGRVEGEPLWPSRFPLEALHRIREAVGSSSWSALYQQRPVAVEGAIFRKEWLKSYLSQPELSRTIFSLDCAFKTGEQNDYSALTVWGEHQTGYYLLDVLRERLDFPPLRSRVVAKAAFWKPDALLVEDTAAGQSLIQVLKLETSLAVLPVQPLGDKQSRASAVSPLFESGRVFIPQTASWLADYIDELCAFPAAPHDDQVDSSSQALMWLRGERRDYGYTPAVGRDFSGSRSSLQIRDGNYVYHLDDSCTARDQEADRQGGGGFNVLTGRLRFASRRGSW
jgi:predicted phage terminase large subunit-like protein